MYPDYRYSKWRFAIAARSISDLPGGFNSPQGPNLFNQGPK